MNSLKRGRHGSKCIEAKRTRSKSLRNKGSDFGDENKVLAILQKKPEITAKKIAEALNVSPRKVSRIIKILRENGTITRIGSDRKGYWEVNMTKYSADAEK